MVIIGYQGIGKSTLAGVNKFIDLESGNFWIDSLDNDYLANLETPFRENYWYIPYCKIALHLSQQGYLVFTSSHKIVRNTFKKLMGRYPDEKIAVCYPSLNLKGFWIDRLQKRYNMTQLTKDYKALMNTKEMYDDNIKDLMEEDKFLHIPLTSTFYNLKEIILNRSMNVYTRRRTETGV